MRENDQPPTGPRNTAPALRGVRDVAAGLCARQQPPGLSVAVVAADGDTWSEGFGVADIETRSPATAETVYLWFSMTKLVTATAVLQLADRGRLDLDRPVADLTPAFPRRGPGNRGGRGDRVTVRHLLSHSAGLANPIPVGWVRPADAPAEDLHAFTARLLARHSRLRAEPGARASYSNLGYLVLGEVIEAAAGAPYTDYVRAHILEPLGMTSTDFIYREEMASRAATGYHPRLQVTTPVLRLLTPGGIFDHPAGRFWALSRFCVQGAPYGGLIGPVSDAARFLALHVDPGAYPAIISAEAVAAMQRTTAVGRRLDVGLGWFCRHGDPQTGPRHWEHLGGGGGFFNTMRVYPDLNLGLVAMGNATGWDHLTLVDAVTRGPYRRD